MNFALFLILSLYSASINGKNIPINLNDNNNSGNIGFNITLPSNDVIEVGLSFKLIAVTYLENNQGNNNSPTTNRNDDDDDDQGIQNTEAVNLTERKYVTVEEAIEGFRKELIRKEMDISGIIESKEPFYRHFKLEFDDDVTLTIRCTYDSDYKERSLKISCYEYREYNMERYLSNGELEVINIQDANYKSDDVALVDLRTMKQTYNMNIL